MVIWDPQNSLVTYDDESEYKGYPALSASDSAAIRRDIARRQREFTEFLELGRTVVVFAPGDVKVFADTGKREYSGTGKNRETTRIVEPVDLWDAIPLKLTLELGSGASITAADETASGLLRSTRGSWSYRSVIRDLPDELRPIFYVRGTKKVVGALARTATDGLLVVLPDYVPDEASAGSHTEALLAWIGSLTGSPDARQPAWASNFLFASEVGRLTKRQEVEAEAARIERDLESLRAEQAADDQWKLLVTGSGAALERQVEKALAILGFDVSREDVGRSDLRGTWKTTPVVVEVKGVTKSASEKNAAQLEKWVSAEVADGQNAKGILVVNTWRDTPLDERKEPDFPDQMLPYSVSRDHCLVTGLQLLGMVREALEDPTRVDGLASTLVGTSGVVEGWGDPADIFEMADVAARETGAGAPEARP